MGAVRGLRVAVVCLCLTAGASWAVTVADYGPQFQGPAPAAGWNYMWNAGGDIGTASNYASLLWTGSRYTLDGNDALPRANPAAYLNLASGGGHPGRGITDGVGTPVDRYPIAAYTLQPGDAGFLQVVGTATVNSTNSNGLDVRVYVNDTQANRIIESPVGGASSINTLLGSVGFGDTVYVAVGPNTDDGFDGFGLSYRIETAAASNLLWDADGAGGGTGGTGTWNTAAATWDSSGGHVTWNNGANDNAYFGAVPGTVMVGVPVTARSLTFQTDGYTLTSPGTITLTDAGSDGAGPSTIAVTDPAATATIAGPISGPSGLHKIGAGSLALDGNTVSLAGRLDVANGTVDLTNSVVTTGGSGTHVANRATTNVDPINAVLNINPGSALTTLYIVGGDGSGSNINGTINQYASTTVTTTGATAENNGLRLGHYPGGNITYNLAGGTLTIGDNRDLSCATDGTGHFLQTGGVADAYRVVVNKRANNGGNGTFEVQGGVFNLGAGGLITDFATAPSTVLLGGLGGTLAAAANWASSLPMTLSGTGGDSIRFDSNGNAITLSGNLSGGGGLRKVGDGTLNILGASNTLAHLYVDGGTVALGGTSVTNVTGNVSVGDTVFSTLVIQDTAILNAQGAEFMVGDSNGVPGAVQQTGGTVTIAGRTRIGHWPNNTSTYTLDNGVLHSTGEFNVGWDGNGILDINGGTATFDGLFRLNRRGTVNQNAGDTFFNTGLRIGDRNGANTATYNMNGGTATAPWISIGDENGTGGQLIQNGGVITVTDWMRVGHWPNNSSSYTINDGSLSVANTLSAGWDSSGTITINGGSIQAGSLNLGDHPNQSGTVTQYGGDVTVTNLLRIGHWPNNTSTYSLSDGTLTLTGTPTGDVNSGAVGEQAGILYLGVDGTGVFTQTDGLASAHGIVLDARSDSAGTDTFTLDGGTFIVGPSGIKSGNYDANTSIQINLGGGTLAASADWTSTLPMTLTGTGGNATVDTSGQTIDLSGGLTGNGGLDKVGAGTLNLIGNQTYRGATTVAGGLLSVANGQLYNDLNWANQVVTVTNGGTVEIGGWADGDTEGLGRTSFNPINLVLDNGTLRYVDTATTGRADRGFTIGAGGATLDASGDNLFSILDLGRPFPIVSNAGGLLTLTGPAEGLITKAIPGTGGVVKTGDGTWTLGGTTAHTYTGTTTVAKGILVLDGTHTGGGAYTVFSGATLAGSGSTTSPVTVQGTGVLDPVNGLSTGSVILESDSIFDIALNGVDDFDYLDVTGIVDLDQAMLKIAMGFMPTFGDEFRIINNLGSEAVRGTFAGFPEGAYVLRGIGGGPNDLQISYVGGDGNDVVLTAVPEPATLTLLGLGGLAALIRRRHRR